MVFAVAIARRSGDHNHSKTSLLKWCINSRPWRRRLLAALLWLTAALSERMTDYASSSGRTDEPGGFDKRTRKTVDAACLLYGTVCRRPDRPAGLLALYACHVHCTQCDTTDCTNVCSKNSFYTVSQKTCDYIFYNNFNNKRPITIIFGIDTSKSMSHRKMVSFPTSPI